MTNNYLIKKLGHQELGYVGDIPGRRAGQYFLMSKQYLDFFPPLKKEIPQHLQILNLVSHGSNLPAQAKYIYDNDKYHGSKAKAPRDEHRINLNKNVNPEKKVYYRNDIIIFRKEDFINENNEKELAYIITRYRESESPIDYKFLNNLIFNNRFNISSKNYCYASSNELRGIINYRNRLFDRVMPLTPIIPKLDESLISIKQSKENSDENENRVYENQIKRLVFDKYQYKCIVTGIGYKWSELGQIKNSWRGLTGAHIKPRAHNGPYSSDNIIPLIEPVHQLFDRGIFTLTNSHKIEIHKDALSDPLLHNFHSFNNKKLDIPTNIQLSNDFINHHRDHIFGMFKSGRYIRSLNL